MNDNDIDEMIIIGSDGVGYGSDGTGLGVENPFIQTLKVLKD